jgi:predicted acyl esterase
VLVADPADPVRHNVKMSDGVLLATDVYLPSAEGKYPSVLVLTPYGRGGVKSLAERLLVRGYAVVSQDIRGRGDSEGSNVVIFQSGGWNEPRDGHRTIEWIASQAWSDGQVATWGGSAVGITQNMLAPMAPPALKAQFVEVASSNLYTQCMYRGGAFHQSMMEGWLLATGMTKGNLEAFHSHPAYDDFWRTMNPESVADRAHAPAIFVGGWYDIFCQGTIDSFVSLQKLGRGKAAGGCRLVMGPWAHGPFTELKYPEHSNNRPQSADFFRFIDHHLLGKENGVDRDLPVHYYVMGDPENLDAPGNEWRSAASWPPESTATRLYLHADATLSEQPPTADDAKSFSYDPKDPVPTRGGQNLILPRGPMDQRPVEDRPDVLLFTSEPLTEAMEVTGRILATIYVSSDAADTDVTVKLCDVYPDGRSMLVADGILRLRYRESFETPKLLTPGEVCEARVDLWSTSLVVAKGHRLRVAVSSSNSPRFDANPNTGKNSWEETSPRVARNTVFLARGRSSYIELPVVGRRPAQASTLP